MFSAPRSRLRGLVREGALSGTAAACAVSYLAGCLSLGMSLVRRAPGALHGLAPLTGGAAAGQHLATGRAGGLLAVVLGGAAAAVVRVAGAALPARVAVNAVLSQLRR